MSPLRLAILTISLIYVAALHAGEPAVELPKPGAWARYHIVEKPENGAEIVFKSTLKFLHQQEHHRVACRWIEIEEHYDKEGKEIVQLYQFLVPERALRDSASPLSETVVANFRDNGSEVLPERLDRTGVFGTALLFLPAARKGSQILNEPQRVDYPGGRIEIPTAQRGKYVWSHEAVIVKQTKSWTWDYDIWVDQKVPVGIARGPSKFATKKTVNW